MSLGTWEPVAVSIHDDDVVVDARPMKPEGFRLKPHQKSAVRRIVHGFRRYRRGQLNLPCGTGKTVIGIYVARRLRARRIVLVAKTIALVEQLGLEWRRHFGAFQSVVICSKQEVADGLHFPFTTQVTTEQAEVRTFLGHDPGEAKVVFCTYASSGVLSGLPSFDLAVIDEAHHCVGDRAGLYKAVLDDGRVTARRRLFMTATPRVLTEKAKAEAGARGISCASMDDRKLYGPVFARMSFGEAIGRKLICDYRVVVFETTNREVIDLLGRRGVRVRSRDAARKMAAEFGLLKAIKRFRLKKVMTFHSRVANAVEFAGGRRGSIVAACRFLPRKYRPVGRLWTASVSGVTPPAERRKKLDLLGRDSAMRILASCRALGEGVDVPAVDGVAIIDPRTSPEDITQAVGRALRSSPGKKIATIVIPVFTQRGVDAINSVQTSAFGAVWHTLAALREHDTRLIERVVKHSSKHFSAWLREKVKVIDANGTSVLEPRLHERIRTLILPCENVSYDKSLGVLFPELTKLLNQHKFGSLAWKVDPFATSTRSQRVVGWWCDAGMHRLRMSVLARVTAHEHGRQVCDECRVWCRGFGSKLGRFWDHSRNAVPYKQAYLHLSGREEFWWRCPDGHSWKRSIRACFWANSPKEVCAVCRLIAHPTRYITMRASNLRRLIRNSGSLKLRQALKGVGALDFLVEAKTEGDESLTQSQLWRDRGEWKDRRPQAWALAEKAKARRSRWLRLRHAA